MNVDVLNFVRTDHGANGALHASLQAAQIFVEKNLSSIGMQGGTITTRDDYLDKALTRRWVNSINGFRHWSQANDIKCKNGVYSMEFIFNIRDYYDFDLTSQDGIGPWYNRVMDRELALMHRVGLMQAFEIEGSVSIEVQWKKGQYGLGERGAEITPFIPRLLENPGGGGGGR